MFNQARIDSQIGVMMSKFEKIEYNWYWFDNKTFKTEKTAKRHLEKNLENAKGQLRVSKDSGIYRVWVYLGQDIAFKLNRDFYVFTAVDNFVKFSGRLYKDRDYNGVYSVLEGFEDKFETLQSSSVDLFYSRNIDKNDEKFLEVVEDLKKKEAILYAKRMLKSGILQTMQDNEDYKKECYL